MKRLVLFLITILLSAGFAQSTVETVLEHIPAQNSQMRDQLSAELLNMGEAAILQVCQKLRPAGQEDAAAKFAVAGLCDYVSRSGGDKERAFVATTLTKALSAANNWQVKSFLIEQLGLVGDKSVVKPLAVYLHDAHLCDPASRAMIAIDPKRAEKPLLAALKNADDNLALTIVNALGEIGSAAAVASLTPLADSKNASLRDVALFALARSGSPKAESLLRQAIANSEGTTQQKAYSYYFDYIEKQSPKVAVRLYRALLDEQPASHLTCRALDGLFQLQKKQALPDLLSAAGREEKDILACALRLSNALKGEEVSRIWSDFAAAATPEKRAMIVAAMGDRHDAAAVSFATAMMHDLNQNVRLAAITSLATLKGPDAYDELLKVLKTGRAQEVEAARRALLSYASTDALLQRLQDDLPRLPPISQAAIVRIFAERRAIDKKEIIFDLAKGDDAQVRLAAMKALSGMTDATDVGRLLALLQNAQDKSELQPLQNALVPAANQADPVAAEPVIEAFAAAKVELKTALLWTLARLNDADALHLVLKNAVDSPLRRDALQALASGPQTTAIPELIQVLAKEEGETRHLALQKAIRLTRDGRGLSDDERLDYCRQLMKIAKDADEKHGIIAIAGKMHTPHALAFVAPFLEFSDTQQDAAEIAVQIAIPQNENETGLSGQQTIDLLYKVLALPVDGETLKKAKAHLQRLGAGRGIDAETGAELNTPPPGFVRLFNGRNLDGWKGLAGKGGNPYERAKLSPEQLKKEQAHADSVMRAHWRIENGVLVFDGHGSHLCTQKEYRNFEMLVDWKIGPGGDSGIYLRGTPQVQIWDTAKWPEGSGGLYNNKKGPSKPLVCADNPVGHWNTFRIKMMDDRVTVYLNDKLVVDNVVLENYWDRSQPIFPKGQIELQSHGSTLYFRNVFIREIFTEEDGWTSLFDGKTLNGWTGAVDGYAVQDGAIVSTPGSGGNLFTKDEYDNFEFTFEFKLTPGANSGLGIRAPLKGDAAYDGMELQILDNSAMRYAHLKPYQYHGSIYGVVPAKRGWQKPVGEWNSEQVIVSGDRVRVELNGVVIVDADIRQASAAGTMDGRKHPGLKRKSGRIGFLGHDALVAFRNIYARAAKH